MILGPVTKFDKKNVVTSKKLTMTSSLQIVTPISCLQFIVYLEQYGSQIPGAWPVILICWIIVTFYLTKTGYRTKLSRYWFELSYCFCQKMLTFWKKMLVSQIKGVVILKSIFSETKYLFVLTYQISNW